MNDNKNTDKLPLTYSDEQTGTILNLDRRSPQHPSKESQQQEKKKD